MNSLVLDKPVGVLFCLLGLAAIVLSLTNLTGLGLLVAIVCVCSGLFTIGLGIFCIATQ